MLANKTRFKEAFDLICEISQDVFEKYAEACDRDNRFPIESFNAIKANNLQSLLVPKQFGGWGLSFYEYQHCLTRMAQSCPSTAAAFNMHNIVVGSVSKYKLDELSFKARGRLEQYLSYFFGLITVEKCLFAAATTEPLIGARFSQVKTTFERTETGYRLDGNKSFVTMANYADYLLVLANKKVGINEKADSQWLTYFLVPRHATGVTINKTWDVLGMRGTSSEDVAFNQVELEKQSVFMGREGFALSKVMREPHWVTGGYLGVYLGIMEEIFQFTCTYIKQRSDHLIQSGLMFNPLIQARIGEMYVLLNNARLNVFESAKKVDELPSSVETQRAIYAAKYYLSESMPKLATLALRTCGGATIHKKFKLERLLRDSCCGGLMPAVSDMCQLFLGKSSLNITDVNIW